MPFHQPSDIRYIKLGKGGRWEQRAFSEGALLFGFSTIPHELCESCLERGDWTEVRRLLPQARVNEIKAFYELGERCLWITFAHGHLWWAFADPNVQWIGEGPDGPSRKRMTVDGWHDTDIHNRVLNAGTMSSKLTKVQHFMGTICKVKKKGYLLRRIKGEVEPIVTRANDARKVMISIAIKMIQGLDWADFETLTDLIFARSGWQRSSRVGENQPDYDLLLEQPTTGETAFVQVKSEATQTELDDYIGRFRRGGYDRFFFVCHSGESLTIPREPRLHLFQGEYLADAAVKNGLYDWLVERSG